MHIDIQVENNDIDELLGFCHDMIEASYFPAYSRTAVDMFFEYHNAASVAADMAAGRIWCARQGGRIVGTVTVSQGELTRMFVSPEMRGKGLGARLAQLALDYARETGIKKLTAWSVPFSRGFYEKLGFRMLNADTLNFNNKRDEPVPYIEMALWPEGAPDVVITRAVPGDSGELLAGQLKAFEEQCTLYGDWRIPPMTETPEMVAEFTRSGGVVLKAVSAGSIIGAIRGNVVEGICNVGRLYVLPRWQGKSVARSLIAVLEESMPDCVAFSIFTGERSEKNLAIYSRHGYELTGRKAPAMEPGSEGNYDLVWLEKPNPWPEINRCLRRVNPL